MIPVLYEVTQEYQVPIVYINAEEEIPFKNGKPVLSEDYHEFVALFNAYLEYNENGEKDLYWPFTVFVKDHSVIYSNIRTVGSHYAPKRPLNEKETEKIKESLRKAYEKLLSNNQ